MFGHLYSNYLHCFRFWSLERVWPKMIRLQSSQTLKNLSLNPFQMIHGSRANQRAAFTTYDRSRPIWPDSRHDRMWNPRWRLQSFDNTEPIRTIRFFCKYTKSITKAACLYLLTVPWQWHIRQLNYQEPNVLLTCWWSKDQGCFDWNTGIKNCVRLRAVFFFIQLTTRLRERRRPEKRGWQSRVCILARCVRRTMHQCALQTHRFS